MGTGWEKDFKTNNPLSAVQVLIEHGSKHANAMSRVIKVHNELVRRCVQYAGLVCDDPAEYFEELDADGILGGTKKTKGAIYRSGSVFGVFRNGTATQTADKEAVRKYTKLIVGFALGMAEWMAESKRYKLSD